MQTTFEFSILFLELFLWILRTTLWKRVGEVIVYILQMRNLILIHTCLKPHSHWQSQLWNSSLLT